MIFSLLCAAPIFAQTVCDKTYNGTQVFAGGLHVPAGKTCTLFGLGSWGGNSEVQGNVTVEGTLLSWGAHITGSVYVNGGNIGIRYSIDNQIPTVIDGDLLITNSNSANPVTKLPTAAPPVVKGNVTVTGNGTDPEKPYFSFFAYGLHVGGSMVVSNNNGPVSLYENVITGNLNCGNSSKPDPAGQGNIAKKKNGVCSAL